MGIIVGGYYSQVIAETATAAVSLSELTASGNATAGELVTATAAITLGEVTTSATADVYVITLSGEININSLDTTSSPWESISGIRVNDDGTIDKVTQISGGALSYTQIDAATDWIIPNGIASSDFQFRLEVGTPPADAVGSPDISEITTSGTAARYTTMTATAAVEIGEIAAAGVAGDSTIATAAPSIDVVTTSGSATTVHLATAAPSVGEIDTSATASAATTRTATAAVTIGEIDTSATVDVFVFTLSGETGINSVDITAPHVATSGIRVNDDGTIDKITQVNGGSLTYTQIDASTDWIIPNGIASSDFQFRLEVTSNGPNYLSDSTDTWIAMGSGSQSSTHLIWMNRRTTEGITNWTWTLRGRRNTGSELDNGSYSGTNDCNPL